MFIITTIFYPLKLYVFLPWAHAHYNAFWYPSVGHKRKRVSALSVTLESWDLFTFHLSWDRTQTPSSALSHSACQAPTPPPHSHPPRRGLHLQLLELLLTEESSISSPSCKHILPLVRKPGAYVYITLCRHDLRILLGFVHTEWVLDATILCLRWRC